MIYATLTINGTLLHMEIDAGTIPIAVEKIEAFIVGMNWCQQEVNEQPKLAWNIEAVGWKKTRGIEYRKDLI